jgi:hypothetical protein
MRREMLLIFQGKFSIYEHSFVLAVAVAFTLSCTSTKILYVNIQVQGKRALIKS